MTKRKQKSRIVTESRNRINESRFNGNYSFAVYFAKRDPRLFEAWYDANAWQLFNEVLPPEPSMSSISMAGDPSMSMAPPARHPTAKPGRMRSWLISALIAGATALGTTGLYHYVNNKLAQQGQPPATPAEVKDAIKKAPGGAGGVAPGGAGGVAPGGVSGLDPDNPSGVSPEPQAPPNPVYGYDPNRRPVPSPFRLAPKDMQAPQ